MQPLLPPLNALRAFEAVARLGSVAAAADELCVTPGAISHQIHQLEGRVGVDLFLREGRSLRLSESGSLYAGHVREAFQQLSDGTRKLKAPAMEGELRIACAPALANLWLMPQLKALRSSFPDISLNVVPDNITDSALLEDIDLAITYGTGDWEGADVVLLTHFEMFPVCHPGFFPDGQLPARVEELQGDWLLHEDQGGHWKRWFASIGARPPSTRSGYHLGSAAMALSAARAGAGIALGDGFVCHEMMSTGSVVRLFDAQVPAQYSYYLVGRQGSFESPRIQSLIDWLEATIATIHL